jgi:hypothetical protein
VAALADSNQILHLWDPSTGKPLHRIKQVEAHYHGEPAIFSPDGSKVLATHHNDFGLYEIATGKLHQRFPFFPDPGPPSAFSPGGGMLVTGGPAHPDEDSRAIHIWDTTTGKELRRLTWQDNSLLAGLVFYADGKHLLVAHERDQRKPTIAPDGRQPTSWRVWDLDKGHEVRRFPDKPSARTLVLTPDGKTLAVPYAGAAILYELATGLERGRFEGHCNEVKSLAFSPNGRLLASGSEDHTAIVWDVTGICIIGKWVEHDASPEQIESFWNDLGSTDGVKAHRAVWKLAAAPRQAIPLLADRLHAVVPVGAERISRLIADLDSADFKVRGQATQQLATLGDLAEPALSKALASNPPLEVERRLQLLLDKLRKWPESSEDLRSFRAIEVLEHVGSPFARQVLAKLAQGTEAARLTKEVRASLGRLKRREVP